jgi:aromatic ring-opening dioxygenase LigB subunit
MLLAAAVCPHPPLLVPEVAAGAAHETDDLRNACRAAVATLPPATIVVGTAQAVEVGRWLLPDAATQVVAPDLPPDDAAALGRTLAERDVALLVMGDGSARRGVAAPGYDDPRAEPYDAAVARALRDADPPALLALDPGMDAELLVAGRAAWQVLAGAAEGGRWRGAVTYDAAPYGVGYLVATWSRA